VSSSNKSAKDTQAAAYIYLQLVILNVCLPQTHTRWYMYSISFPHFQFHPSVTMQTRMRKKLLTLICQQLSAQKEMETLIRSGAIWTLSICECIYSGTSKKGFNFRYLFSWTIIWHVSMSLSLIIIIILVG